MSSDEKTQIVGPPDPVAVGTQLSGTYELDKRIASGGMGEVYRGHNIQTGDPVAIKIVLPEFARDATILSLFRKEASILNHLFHEAIVRYHVFAIDQTIGRPYLAMEFVDGTSLVDMFTKGPMDPEDARKLLVRLASGLAVAHAAGVIHRDLSPDNIVLPGGKVERAKIIDFGIARSATVGGETLLGGSFAGKYNFVSPEQLGMAGGEVTERSDIYSLGLVIAAALQAKTINMTGSQVDIIEKRRVVPDLSGIDPRMRPVVDAMLQPDPRNRPTSMTEIVEGLQRLPQKKADLWEAPAAPPEPTRALVRDGPASPAIQDEQAWPAGTSRTPMPWQSVSTPGAATAAPQSGQAAPGVTDAYGTTFPRGATAVPSAGPARKSGGLVIAVIAVVALAGAGGGAYFGGLFDAALKPKTETAPPQPVPEPQPAEQPAPEPSTPEVQEPPPAAPEPAAPVVPDEPPAAEQPETPAPTPVEPIAPTPPPANEVVIPNAPADAGEQTQPPPPATQSDSIGQRRDWLKTYAGGDCFFATASGSSGDKLQIEGFGQTVQPFEAMLEAFKAAFPTDPEPDIGVRLIQAKQCAAPTFLEGLARSPNAAPTLVMTKDVLFDGDPMSGTVQLQPNRQTYLLLIDHDGIVHNLDGILKRLGDKADFSVQLGLGTGKGVGKAPLPQLLIAISASAPVSALGATTASPAFELLPRVAAELADKKIDGSASARYFRIRG